EKDALKKKGNTGIDPANFDEVAIEYIEGRLSADEQKTLKAFTAQNPHYARELELYTKTKIVADNTIVFEDKLSLKKGAKKPVAWYYWSAAASVAIIVGSYFVFSRSEGPVVNTVAQHTSVKDGNTIANQTSKTIDTVAANKNATPISVISKTKNNHVIASVKHSKQSKNEKVTFPATTKDSAIVIINRSPDINVIDPATPVPALPEDSLRVAKNNYAPDTSCVGQPLIIVRDIQPEEKKSKFLVGLATLTCKGL